MNININTLKSKVDDILSLLEEVSNLLLKIQSSNDYDISVKNDGSKVTTADIMVQKILIDRISILFPGVAIVSEEFTKEESELSRSSKSYIIIDPIDGTGCFINGLTFSVNLAFMHNGRILFGAIAIPQKYQIYYAVEGQVTKIYDIKEGKSRDLRLHNMISTDLEVIVSNRFLSGKHAIDQVKFFGYLDSIDYKVSECIVAPASTKYCDILEKSNSVAISYGTLMDWDIVAAIFIANSAGLYVCDISCGDFDFSIKSGLYSGIIVAKNKKIAHHIAKALSISMM